MYNVRRGKLIKNSIFKFESVTREESRLPFFCTLRNGWLLKHSLIFWIDIGKLSILKNTSAILQLDSLIL